MSVLIAMQDIRRSIAAIARRAEQGEEFIVIRNSRPSFRIIPYREPSAATAPMTLTDITARIDRTRAASRVKPRDLTRALVHARKRRRA